MPKPQDVQATLLTDFASAILINRCNEFIYIAAAKCEAKGSKRIWVDNTGESLQKTNMRRAAPPTLEFPSVDFTAAVSVQEVKLYAHPRTHT